MCIVCASCAAKAPSEPSVPPAQNVTPPPDKLPKNQLTPIQNTQNIVITEDMCSAAKNKISAAEYKIATYYDALIDVSLVRIGTGKKEVTKSQKAMVAAMYWYDLAIHYGGKDAAGKNRRRALGLIASEKVMTLYRSFSQNKKNPPCMPVDVFDGVWFE